MGLILGLLVAASATVPDRWTGEAGPALAGSVIEKCLSEAKAQLSDLKKCMSGALDLCEDEHGTYQRAMNDCATFSRLAWETRRAAVAKRLGSARQANGSPSPDPYVLRLEESERRWDAWNRADCEMQAAFSEGGSYHRFATDTCLSDHAAHRAIELEALQEEWGKIFDFDES